MADVQLCKPACHGPNFSVLFGQHVGNLSSFCFVGWIKIGDLKIYLCSLDLDVEEERSVSN